MGQEDRQRQESKTDRETKRKGREQRKIEIRTERQEERRGPKQRETREANTRERGIQET